MAEHRHTVYPGYEDIWSSMSDDRKRYTVLNHLLVDLNIIARDSFGWAIDRRHDGIRTLFNKDVSTSAGGKRNLMRTIFDLLERVGEKNYLRIVSEMGSRNQVTTYGGLDPEKLADGSVTSFWREAAEIGEKCLERLQHATARKKTIVAKDFPGLQEDFIESLEAYLNDGKSLFSEPSNSAALQPSILPKPT